MTRALKPVARETATFYRGRALVATIHPRHLELREKGRRHVLAVDYATLYEFAAKLRWRREQAEKRAAKTAKPR